MMRKVQRNYQKNLSCLAFPSSSHFSPSKPTWLFMDFVSFHVFWTFFHDDGTNITTRANWGRRYHMVEQFVCTEIYMASGSGTRDDRPAVTKVKIQMILESKIKCYKITHCQHIQQLSRLSSNFRLFLSLDDPLSIDQNVFFSYPPPSTVYS